MSSVARQIPMGKCAGLLAILLLSFAAQATTSITLYSDHPLDIPLTDDTLSSNVIRALEHHSQGQIHFEFQLMPQNRGWLTLNKISGCLVNQIKTPERESKAIFSRFPLNLYPPLRLIAPTNFDKRWPVRFTPNAFNLPQDLPVGLVNGRSYGDAIDGAIARTPQHYFVRGGTQPAERTLDMLIAKRISSTIDYSRSVRVYLDGIKSNFSYQAIAIEGADSSVAGYLACSKDSHGQAMIAAIDSIFATEAMLADYIRFHRKYFGEEEAALLEEEIRDYYRQLKSQLDTVTSGKQ